MNKGYRVTFSTAKIKDHIENIKAKYDAEIEKTIQLNKEEYDRILKKTLKEINNCPIQFCEETIKKYFYDKWFDNLLLCENSDKNKIIIEAINSKLQPHTKEYEKELDLLFKAKKLYLKDFQFSNNIKEEFLKNLVVRTNVIENFSNIWKILIFENKNLSKHDKNNLLKKYSIIKENSNKFTDASIIRFKNFVNNFNGGGSVNFKKDFTASLSDNAFLQMIVNIVDIELSVLINELETVKFDQDVKLFVLNNNYSNIINDYYKFIGNDNSKLSEDTQTGVDLELLENENEKINNQLNKINILYSLVETFNKQYKYKYQWLYAKSLLKKIIKIK